MAKRKLRKVKRAVRKAVKKRIVKKSTLRRIKPPVLPPIKTTTERKSKFSMIVSMIFLIFVFVIVLMMTGLMTSGVRNFSHAQNIFTSSDVVKNAWLDYKCLVPLQDSVNQIINIEKDDYKISCYQGSHYIYKSAFVPCDRSLAINVDYSLRGGSSFIPMDLPIPDSVEKYYLVIATCSDTGTYADASVMESTIYAVIDAATGKVY